MAFLYINVKGKEWKKHSYSAGNTFTQCPLKYMLQKVYGWREKSNKARFELGKAFESAIQYYHEHQGDLNEAIKHFEGQWTPWKDAGLHYTKVEKDWDQCLRIGKDWLRLYAIRQPDLPIPLGGNTLFQREYAKEVFPSDPNYGEIEDAGKLDIVTYVNPMHPLLPKLDWKPEYGALRPLIVDIKTSGSDYPDAYGIAAYDVQLRRYSWLSNIRDVALLAFIKKSPSLQKGYSVTLLEDAGYMKAGQEAVIAGMDKGTGGAWLLANDFMVEEMERVQGVKGDKTDQTKEAKARRDAWLEENGVLAPVESLTKQRLQFNAGYVSIESANDAGGIAAQQIIAIVTAWKTQNYPNTFGVRYPHDDRSDPYFRAFVLNDEAYKNENFEKVDEDIDLFAEEDTEIEQ